MRGPQPFGPLCLLDATRFRASGILDEAGHEKFTLERISPIECDSQAVLLSMARRIACAPKPTRIPGGLTCP